MVDIQPRTYYIKLVDSKEGNKLMVNVYPITGKVWYRESTDEWVLELEGSINDTHFISRHTEPGNTAPEDVAGLPSLYKEETN